MIHEIYISRDVDNLGFDHAEELIRRAANMALEAEGVSEPCLIDAVLTDDEGIRATNREFRQVDAATDVLSFPFNELEAGNFDPELCERDPETGSIVLGDMMISIPHCRVQGEEFGHGFDREIMYLTVHSVLHLLGYDHLDEGPMKKQMRDREKTIMGDKD